LRRQFTPVGIGLDGFAELQFGDETGLIDDLLQALPQAHVVDIRRRCAVGAVQAAVAQGRRNDRTI